MRTAHTRIAHGRTPAAWTAVTVMIVGALAAGAGMIAARVWLFWVGAAVAVLGVVVGKSLAMMGFGTPPGYLQPRDERTRDEWVADRREAPAVADHDGR